MTSALEQSPGQTIGDVFRDIHQRAHAIATLIPILDPLGDGPEVGEVYSHHEEWIHPKYHMPASARIVRVATENLAPHLLEVWSLHPVDQPGVALPCLVRAMGVMGCPGVQIELQEPNGLITLERGTSYNALGGLKRPREQRRHQPTTEQGKLKSSDRQRLNEVKSGILGMITATRCLVSVDMAIRQTPVSGASEERLQLARATVSDVFALGWG